MTTKKSVKVIIKHKDLNKVMADCSTHIGKLLEKSTKYFNEGDYPISTVLCIVALEEIGKLEIFGEHQRELRDVLKPTMKKLTSHKYKLTQFLESERTREINSLKNMKKFKEINKSVEYHKSQLLPLNVIKQLGLYYNYDKCNTITLETHFMKNSITKNNLAHFCMVLHELTNYRFDSAVLRSQCGSIDGNIDESSDCVKENKNYQRIQEYTDKIKKKKYEVSLQKFQSTLLELRKLVDYLDNN